MKFRQRVHTNPMYGSPWNRSRGTKGWDGQAALEEPTQRIV